MIYLHMDKCREITVSQQLTILQPVPATEANLTKCHTAWKGTCYYFQPTNIQDYMTTMACVGDTKYTTRVNSF
jgi:hypothetical protein